MWNRPVSPATPGIVWSPEQLARLKHEWGRLQWSFACHPLVRVIPLEGDPPRSYELVYRVRTLALTSVQQLDYALTASVQVELGPDYPFAAPIVRPVSKLFHPNISDDAVEIFPAWQSSDTLVDLVQRIGALLAFQSYDPYTALNESAMEWIGANAGYLPTDAQANFAPSAGGEPLQRIAKNGAAALEQFRRELDLAGASVVAGTFALTQVEHFAHRTRLGLGIFSAPGVEASMLQTARELEQWAGELPLAAPLLEELGRMKSASTLVRQSATALEKSVQSLGDQFQAIEHLRPEFKADQPAQIPGHLPPANVLEGIHAKLRSRASSTETALAAARKFARPAAPPPTQTPPAEASFCKPLQNAIQTHTQTQLTDLNEAYDQLARAIADAGPLVQRAAHESAAVEKIVAYRQYADLQAKAEQLVEKTKAWGSAGIQAYFVASAGETYGPFQFEQVLDLGSSPLVVRAVGRNALEAIDVASGMRLARGDGAEMHLPTPGSDDPAQITAFQATVRCDDMAMQLDYLHRQLQSLLPRVGGTAPETASWCGKALAAMTAPAAFEAFKGRHAAAIETLQTLVHDLGVLSPFKERLATYFLVQRLRDSVERWQQDHLACRNQITKANTRVAQIISRSGKDMVNDAPVIPAKFEKDYNQSLEQRERAHEKMEQLDRLIASAVKQARVRLESFSQMGTAALPTLKMMSPLPGDLAALAPAMDDANFAQDIAQLGQLMGVEFAVKDRGARAARPPE